MIETDHAGSLEILNPLDEIQWDNLLATHPESSFFHSAAWANVLHDTYGYQPFYFTRRKDARLVSLAPMMEVKSGLTGKRGVGLPFTDSCALLGCHPVLDKATISEAMERGKQRGWKYLEWRGGRDCFGSVPAWNTFFTHDLQLGPNPQSLLPDFNSATRRAIKSAEKAEITIEIDNSLEGVQGYYLLHCKTRKRHGLPPQPFRFFRNIHRHVLSQNGGMVMLAKAQRIVVAAAVYVHLGRRAIYKFGASDSRFQHLRGNNAVMWEAIQWYCRNGFQTLNFGRTSLANEGLRRFKLGWGAEERRLEYVRYDLQKNLFLSGQDKAFGWHNHVFKRLPLPLLRMVGALIYRHLA